LNRYLHSLRCYEQISALDEPLATPVRKGPMKTRNDTKIDTHKALLAANAIMRYGVNTSRGMQWHGVIALSDPDGYTVTLMDDNVELRLLFHNKFQLKSRNRFAQTAFIEKLEHLLVLASNRPDRKARDSS